jgi:replicative DNA helicase
MIAFGQIRQEDICSDEAERGALGSLIHAAQGNPARVGEAIGTLGLEHFFRAENQAVFQGICDVYLETSGVDVLILQERLKRGNELQDVGGAQAYLIEIGEMVCGDANLDYFVGVLKDKANNRRVIQTVEAISDVVTGYEQPDAKIEEIQRLALELTPRERTRQVHSVAEEAEDALEEVFADKTGLKTGFDALDWHLGGMHAGDLIISAARPSVGDAATVDRANDCQHSPCEPSQGPPEALYTRRSK